MKIIWILLFISVYSDNEGITVEEGETYVVDADDINITALEIITDISDNDQPTRINNSIGEKTYYILEAEGVEYFVTIDSDIVPETVLAESFLQISNY